MRREAHRQAAAISLRENLRAMRRSGSITRRIGRRRKLASHQMLPRSDVRQRRPSRAARPPALPKSRAVGASNVPIRLPARAIRPARCDQRTRRTAQTPRSRATPRPRAVPRSRSAHCEQADQERPMRDRLVAGTRMRPEMGDERRAVSGAGAGFSRGRGRRHRISSRMTEL